MRELALVLGLALAGGLGAVARVALVRAVARLQLRLRSPGPRQVEPWQVEPRQVEPRQVEPRPGYPVPESRSTIPSGTFPLPSPERKPETASRRGLSSVSRPFPAGTLAVNVLGAFGAGWIVGAGVDGTGVGWLLVVGFFGAFTTFSTWMVELRLRPLPTALLYLLATLLLGVGAAAAGLVLGGR